MKAWSVVMACALLLGAAQLGVAQEPVVRLVHDADNKQLVVVIGPVDLRAGAMVPEEAASPHQGGHEAHGAVFPEVTEVAIPISAYLYGFTYEVLDQNGNTLPTVLLHHLNLINPDYQELFLPISQRMLAIGKETGNQSMPRLFLGYPVAEGTRMVVAAMLHNPIGRDLPGVTVRLALKYVKAGRPWPLLSVYPFQLDVAFPAGDKTLDLPPGRSAWSHEASPAMAGRIMVIGGHLHEFAVSIRFEDVTENKVIWEGLPITDENDQLVGVTIGRLYRKLGAKITPDHVYRVTVTYDNPFQDTLYSGGMGVIGGVFMPSQNIIWPVADQSHELYLLDRRHYMREVNGRYDVIAGLAPAAAEHTEHRHE